MAIPLVRGRLFGPGDGPDAQHVAVISESLAATQWPDEDPIGKFIYYGNMDGDPRAFTIVGIVGDVHQSSLETEPRPTFYGYYRQRLLHGNTAGFSLVLYGATDAVSLISAARRILAELDPDLPAEFRTVEQVYAASLAERRFGFAAGLDVRRNRTRSRRDGRIRRVISFAVAQRTREIGIRLALGARAPTVLRLVLNLGLRLAAIGAAIGAVVALAASRLLASFLFGASETDATKFLVPLILIGAALIAAYIPARRAARTDPVLAMRTE